MPDLMAPCALRLAGKMTEFCGHMQRNASLRLAHNDAILRTTQARVNIKATWYEACISITFYSPSNHFSLSGRLGWTAYMRVSVLIVAHSQAVIP